MATVLTDKRSTAEDRLEQQLGKAAGRIRLNDVLTGALALLVNQKLRGVTLFRALYFLPVVTSWVVVALLWKWLLNPSSGLVNWVLGRVGLDGPGWWTSKEWAMPSVIVAIMWRLFFQPQAGIFNELLYRAHLPGSNIDWLSSFSWALPAIIIVGVWTGMPQTTVMLLAGVQAIPDDLHEAAAVDGASTWQRFRTITLPQLRPVIFAITSLDLIWNFNSFGLVWVLTEGGPGHSTELPMLFAYNEAFKYGEFGYASALGDAMVVVIAAIMVVYLWGRLKETSR